MMITFDIMPWMPALVLLLTFAVIYFVFQNH